MFMDTDLNHDNSYLKKETSKEKKPYKPSNKQIFKDYKEPNKKPKSKK